MNATETLICAISLIWLGALIGVSFIATPAKFLIAELELTTAIKVGRVTFKVFHYFEYAMLAAMVLALFIKPTTTSFVYWLVIVGIVLLQQLWILPELAKDSNALFARVNNAAGSAHKKYIVIELIKLITLAAYYPVLKMIK